MATLAAENKQGRPRLLQRAALPGCWEVAALGSRVRAGILGRHAALADLQAAVPAGAWVQAEQVHGASIAIVERATPPAPIPGCDALLTRWSGTGLLIRTADCLPLFMCDASKGAVGLAHVGWRGLHAGLPQRLVAAFQHAVHSDPKDLAVAVGPGIRSCCYEVGPEFAARFGPFVSEDAGRRVCDLAGAAIAQVRQAGVPAARITDCGRCTSCEADQWYSIRRDGSATGRLFSFIMMTP